MLKKRNRLRLRQEKNFFSQAVRFPLSGYSLFIRNKVCKQPQIAVVVGKKIAPLASRRQVILRKARVCCGRAIRSSLLAPLEYVLVLKKEFVRLPEKQVVQELQEKANKVYSSTGK
ncbi:MAG: ribonuclease P protein component [Candidatus Pacebacteria bacterium]|nr:ribonuclease P protein component [Candidatus Paceibacterota bacterium]PIR60896.1 MAG: hypothetical protein COU67_00360 [Candidatus Pacebacteria bacterium CG10_big_fil_rev_8_21_14_0_10_44_54]